MTARNQTAPLGEDAIRARAYQIWEEEGRPEGRHEFHWQRALEWFASRPAAPLSAVPAKTGAATGKTRTSKTSFSKTRASKTRAAPKKT